MDLYEALDASRRVMVRVTCAECEKRPRPFLPALGIVHDSPKGPLYVPDGVAALRRLEGSEFARPIVADVKKRRAIHGLTGKVQPLEAIDIALIADGGVTLAEPRSTHGDAPDLIAYCLDGHGDRPLTIGRLEGAIAEYRGSGRRAHLMV